MVPEHELPAGDFSTWLENTGSGLLVDEAADVPCGSCNACCRASYFVDVEPDENEALARIPEDLLFAAPGRPDGYMVLGFGEDGCCPMLVNDRCSIYEARPRACRAYDCRVFAAGGIAVDERSRQAVAEQVLRWEFSYSTESGRDEHSAIRAAANFLQAHAEDFPEQGLDNSTQLALLAINVHQIFLGSEAGPGKTPGRLSDGETLATLRQKISAR
jgi:Fe-S-cluster containining protein